MKVIKNYQNDKILRDSFNALAQKIFCLNFEDWYQNGFWTDNYIPYSVVENDRVVSNISVNRCDMEWDGEVLHLIQLGTVMTDPEYRGRGYSRLLMEEILRDYAGRVDGIYLFANDTVLDFYPKFGFRKRSEYQYSKNVQQVNAPSAQKVPMDTLGDWQKMVEIIDTYHQIGRLNMVGNPGLIMFYLSSFMKENVYSIPALETYAVAEKEDGELRLYAVFSKKSVELDDVIRAFGSDVSKVTLAFTPVNAEGYVKQEIQVEDTTLFVQGEAFERMNAIPFMFPEISHA